MTVRAVLTSALGAFLVAVLTSPTGSAQGPSAPAAGSPAAAAAVMKTYCITCHNDRTKTGELTLEHADLTDVPASAALWEKAIRKVRAGQMPPAGMPRPDGATL